MRRRICFVMTAILLCVSSHAQDLPDASRFLPGPPETTSVQYIKDYLQYVWGKSLRDSTRGQQAVSDFSTEISTYLKAYSKVLNTDLTSGMPKLNLLFEYCMNYGIRMQNQAQKSYSYRRPYARFKDKTLIPAFEDTYRDVSSYPASQALFGWMYAMVLTEIAPDRQNEILARGYDFGASSVISGYHWDSDVYAGFLLASALVSRLHTFPGFSGMITAARTEYEKKTGVKNPTAGNSDEAYFAISELPDAYKYLPAPPETISPFFACDLSAYEQGKAAREDVYGDLTETGQQALTDITYSADNFCKVYSPIFGKEISATATPQLYKLMSLVHPLGNGATQTCKAYYMRPRPYVQMNELTLYAPDEDHLRDTGSYPSGHASGSWLHALVLAEINPDAEEALLARAYLFGQGRVVSGYHWQSDVDMGRLVASAIFARLHTNTAFLEQLELARQEYKGTSAIRDVRAEQSEAPVYNLQGIRVDSPSHPGVYIQDGRKVVY